MKWYHRIDETLILVYAVKKGPTFHTFQNRNKNSIINKLIKHKLIQLQIQNNYQYLKCFQASERIIQSLLWISINCLDIPNKEQGGQVMIPVRSKHCNVSVIRRRSYLIVRYDAKQCLNQNYLNSEFFKAIQLLQVTFYGISATMFYSSIFLTYLKIFIFSHFTFTCY